MYSLAAYKYYYYQSTKAAIMRDKYPNHPPIMFCLKYKNYNTNTKEQSPRLSGKILWVSKHIQKQRSFGGLHDFCLKEE